MIRREIRVLGQADEMALFHDIQADLLNGSANIGPVLLKVRFLAAKLGSSALEEWVKHEADGYPDESEIPEYRVLTPTYRGSFSGPFGSGIKNAQIPSVLIAKFAGDHWVKFKIRQSIASIEKLIESSSKDGNTLQIECSNLIMLLQGNVYEDLACNDVTGLLSPSQFVNIQNSVRSKLLELTIALESEFPDIVRIEIASSGTRLTESELGKVTYMSQKIIYGNNTSISNSGDNNTFNLNIKSGDVSSVIDELIAKGIDRADAEEFAAILASEKPQSREEPFGEKARDWIAKSIGKAASGAWKAGVAVATSVLTEAALRFYGLK